MGAWGTAIFSDDVAADVRDLFTDYVADGMDPKEATDRAIAESLKDAEDDDEIVVWLALAATQWKIGRLIATVRDRAIKIIDSGEDLKRWNESSKSDIKSRTKHLADLRAQLLTPPSPPKKLKRYKKSTTDFQPGDVFLYRLTARTSMRFAVLRLWSDRGGTYTSICMLGKDDGKPFRKQSLTSKDAAETRFHMLTQEPTELITIERRGVKLPRWVTTQNYQWPKARFSFYLTWKEVPDKIRYVLRNRTTRS